MRDRTPATVDQLSAHWERLSPRLDALQTAAAAPVDRALTALRRKVDQGISERTLEIYADQCVGILELFARDFTRPTSVPKTTESLLAVFEAHLNNPACSGWQRKLDRAVVREMIAGGVFVPYLLPTQRTAIPRREGETPEPATTLVDLYFTDRAAWKMLETTKSLVAARAATPGLVLRNALVAMCRWAGAQPADLVAMTFSDLAADINRAGADEDTDYPSAWMAAARRRAAAPQSVQLALPTPARQALRYWLALRATLTGDMAPAHTAFVFVDPESHARLERIVATRIISGLLPEYQTGVESLWNPLAYEPTQSLSELMPDGPPAVLPEKVLVSATRLRTCHLVALVQAHRESAPALDAACLGAFGTTQAGLPRRHARKILGIEDRTPRSRPRRTTRVAKPGRLRQLA